MSSIRIVQVCEGIEDPAPADNGLYLYHDLTPRVLATPRHYAYIKIAEGCDHPCTFCVIPQYRGKFRSRRFESVVSEATRLFSQGVREINLIGQDTTCYGEDFGLKDGLAFCWPASRRSKRRSRSGCASSMRIRTKSRRNCSTRLPSTRRW
jgi:ribosomal protein S12 methylthiotransferase